MRRFALAAISLVFCSAPVFAQSQIQQLPRTTPETATADSPLPAQQDATHPSTPNPAGPVRVTPREPEPPSPIRAAAPDIDQLSGHLRVGIGLGFSSFSGHFLSQAPIGENLAGGWLPNVDAALGLSRHLELVIAGDFSSSLAGSGCGDCSAKSWAIGPMLRYHLVEGTRFTPWLALGLAYRHVSWTGPSYSAPLEADAIDFLRLALGGDWYATSNVAFGPSLGLGLSVAPAPPDGTDGRVFALIHAGIRVVLDMPGR